MMSIQPYIVQPGDGFARIASKLGSVIPYEDMEYIARANGMGLTSVLHPGRILWYDAAALTTSDNDNRVIVTGERRVTTDGASRVV